MDGGVAGSWASFVPAVRAWGFAVGGCALGIVNTCPRTSRSGSLSWLAAASAVTVTLLRSAISERVSPALTRYDVARGGGLA